MKNNVVHPLKPLIFKDSEILILGSFPSVKSRENMFFYMHPQNRFWKILEMRSKIMKDEQFFMKMKNFRTNI